MHIHSLSPAANALHPYAATEGVLARKRAAESARRLLRAAKSAEAALQTQDVDLVRSWIATGELEDGERFP